jgi:hypothetical protein
MPSGLLASPQGCRGRGDLRLGTQKLASERKIETKPLTVNSGRNKHRSGAGFVVDAACVELVPSRAVSKTANKPKWGRLYLCASSSRIGLSYFREFAQPQTHNSDILFIYKGWDCFKMITLSESGEKATMSI